MSPKRGIPTSRAYWELKADQVLNRVFEAESAIEVEVLERPPKARQAGLVMTCIGVTSLIAAGGGLLLISLWSQSQQSLRQERNLLLLERLRNLGPTAAEPAEAMSTAATDGLPPPPPKEPWIQELAKLPSSGPAAAEPIRVPVPEPISSPAPAASGPSSGSAAPQLLGVVQVPGRSGSAIFQVGGSSTSAAVGDSIGSSGWRLVSASGDSAVIERGGEQRRLSISGGF